MRSLTFPSLALLLSLTPVGCASDGAEESENRSATATVATATRAPEQTPPVAAASASSPAQKTAPSTRASSSAPTAAPTAAPRLVARPIPPSPLPPVRAESAIVRGIYVNRWGSQSPRKMASLIALADSTEINAFVIDIKDEFGINYVSQDTLVRRNGGRAGSIPNLRPLLDTLQSHGILAIARIVVFKDSVTARLNPGWRIRTAEDSTWRDKEGLAWVNPYNPALWDYNIRVAEEVTRLGFDEIQWDYIRFPEPYRSLPPQVFPGADGRSKTAALAGFLDAARERLGALGVRSTADVFGLVTTVQGALEVGQSWEPLSPRVDVILPMVYPSHYPRGSFGVARPNADPYTIVYQAISKAHARDVKLGIGGEHVRTWIQAFTLGQPPYGAREIELQKQAVYDAGYDGWILWHPGSSYGPFRAALERETISRKRAWTPGMPPSRAPVPIIVADSTKPAATRDSAPAPLPVKPTSPRDSAVPTPPSPSAAPTSSPPPASPPPTQSPPPASPPPAQSPPPPPGR